MLVFPLDFVKPTEDPNDIIGSTTFVHFTSYERMSTKQSAYDNDIYLYLPEKMAIPSTVKWDMSGIGIIGQQIENSLRGNKDTTVANSVVGVGGAAVTGMVQKFAKSVDGNMQVLNGNMYNAEHLAGLAVGGIPNPYMTMLFKGVDPRAFEFSFKFYPQNIAEAYVIHNIIKAFRADALPPGSQSYNPVALGYPKEFEIEYMLGGKGHVWLNRFKRSVLTKIDVDYTGASMWSCSSQMQYPTYIVLNMTFTELEVVLRDDVLGGY